MVKHNWQKNIRTYIFHSRLFADVYTRGPRGKDGGWGYRLNAPGTEWHWGFSTKRIASRAGGRAARKLFEASGLLLMIIKRDYSEVSKKGRSMAKKLVKQELVDLSKHVESLDEEIPELVAGEDLEDWLCEMAVVHARCMLLLVRAITDRGA